MSELTFVIDRLFTRNQKDMCTESQLKMLYFMHFERIYRRNGQGKNVYCVTLKYADARLMSK